MKYKTAFRFLLFIFFISFKSYGEDALTINQQLDRLIEEVKDLNKAVFNKSFDKNSIQKNKIDNIENEKFTSIDLRIYDLEKDIKRLTYQLEEIIFALDDIFVDMENIEEDFNNKIENLEFNSTPIKIESDQQDVIINKNVSQDNSLGKIVISEKNIENLNSDKNNFEKNVNEKDQMEELKNLTPENQLQLALDQMMKKNYEKSKKILDDFIGNFPDNQLSGSAHFWLGKIYLFEENYRKAAIVFGEGVQKYPKSIKAPEMYYELVKSLKEMDKTSEACKTIKLLEEKYKESKFSKDPEKIKTKLVCKIND